MKTRGIRNKNPFNIIRSVNSWQGKLKYSSDVKFEQFVSMDYGIRAGILLLLNGYCRKNFHTIPSIIAKFAPSSENETSKYIDFVVKNTGITSETVINVHDNTFYLVCRAICLYESRFELSLERYNHVVKRFNLF